MKKIKQKGLGFLSGLCLLLLLSSCGGDSPFIDVDPSEEGCANAQAMNVLFVGDSFTYTNNLPSEFENLACAAGYKVNLFTSAYADFRFEEHAGDIRTLSAISSEQWDYVVLQNEGRDAGLHPSTVSTASLPQAQILASRIESTGSAEIIYFVTWGFENGDSVNCGSYAMVCDFIGHTQALLDGYQIYLGSTGGTLADVGEAFRLVFVNGAPVVTHSELYAGDGIHPSDYGSYMAAAVLFATIFKESPEGNPYLGSHSATRAHFLQEMAAIAAGQ